MLNYILFGISLCLGVSKNLVSKAGKTEFASIDGMMSANIITGVTALIIFSVQGLNLSVAANPLFVLLALLYGGFTLGSQSLYIRAVKEGPVSVCSLIYAFCFLIPTIIMALYFHEEIKWSWIVGIVLMICSLVMIVFKGKVSGSSSKKYLIYVFMAMVCAGTVGMMQKCFGVIFGDIGYNEFLFLSFGFMALIALAAKLIAGKKHSEPEEPKPDRKRFWICGVALALSQVIANKLNMILAAALPAVFFFPVINGGTILLSSVLSGVFFKEKISASAWVGILIGIAAIALIAV